MTTFKDILKKSFLEGYGSASVSIKEVIIAMLLTMVIALYIFLIYRLVTRKTFYSKNFNITLVGIAVITSAIIVTIQSSVIVSLGMVGALSIVRFRTAVKEPMDLMFLFWSIGVGIMSGAGFAAYAVILSVVLTAVVLLLDFVPVVKTPMVLIINSSNCNITEQVIEILKSKSSHYKIKSRNMTNTSLDLAVEIRTKEAETIIKAISDINGVNSVSIIENVGEVTY